MEHQIYQIEQSADETNSNASGEDYYKNKVIRYEYYPSNVSDTFIRNAVTGRCYPFKVGSNESRRLFKVIDAIGNIDSNGRKIQVIKKHGVTTPINPDPNHLYYNSPEEYTRHRHCEVHPELIKKWKERCDKYFV
jgi:hypothetical protein